MHAVRVEACGVDDAGLLGEIGERTFRETYAADTPADQMEAHVREVYDPATIERALSQGGSTSFLARVEGSAAGYMKLNRGEAQTELRDEAGLEIESLYVLRAFQGRMAV